MVLPDEWNMLESNGSLHETIDIFFVMHSETSRYVVNSQFKKSVTQPYTH